MTDEKVEYPERHVAARSEHSPWWMDAVELACVVALGQRYSILGPARSGRSTILRELGRSIVFAEPTTAVFVVLVDQPVEERMEWRADLPTATVLSADADDGLEAIAELTGQLEASLDASSAMHKLVLIDSMSSLLRAVNAYGPDDPRILTGGITQQALVRIRGLHGLGRAMATGETVTTICTSMMGGEQEADELLARELIGTGNAELHLHPTLARAEVFPPIDLERSGARGEERIVGEATATARARLRARCLERGTLAATELLLDGIKEHGSLSGLLAELSAD